MPYSSVVMQLVYNGTIKKRISLEPKLPNANIKVGQKAIVKIYALNFKTFEGEIIEIMPEKSNLIPARIKITTGLKDRKIKTKSKVFVKVKTN